MLLLFGPFLLCNKHQKIAKSSLRLGNVRRMRLCRSWRAGCRWGHLKKRCRRSPFPCGPHHPHVFGSDGFRWCNTSWDGKILWISRYWISPSFLETGRRYMFVQGMVFSGCKSLLCQGVLGLGGSVLTSALITLYTYLVWNAAGDTLSPRRISGGGSWSE